jgi:hypothetical protein
MANLIKGYIDRSDCTPDLQGRGFLVHDFLRADTKALLAGDDLFCETIHETNGFFIRPDPHSSTIDDLQRQIDDLKGEIEELKSK